jgi:predicted Zn-dependent peptidase
MGMYNFFTMKNGLRVVVENIDYVNSVSVGLWVENGSRNEGNYNNGISHFIEHMFFKGTNNRSTKEIAEDIEDVGGQINAFTGKEATCFYVKALDTHLELSLDILSDMLFNSKFTVEDIEKEKGVVIEEINMSEDTPEDVLSDLHSKAIWGNDPISFPILGTIDTVRSFTREQLLKYVNSYFIPENSVISICGKVDLSKIENIVDRYFGNWDSSNKKVTVYTEPRIMNHSLSKIKNIEQLHIGLGLQGLPMGHNDMYTLLLLNNVIGGGVSSLLFQKVREDYGFCYSIYSYISTFNKTGVITIYTGLNPSYAADALNLIKAEIDDFTKKGISHEKLHKAKEQIKGNYILGLESTSSRMFSNGKSVLFFNKIREPIEVMKKIDNINYEDLNRVMENTFKRGILNSAFVGDNFNVELYRDILEPSKVAFKEEGSKSL